jgi:hypothetical protein
VAEHVKGMRALVKLLVTSAHPTLQQYRKEHLGRLVQPRHYSSVYETAQSGMPWAADNDAFKDFKPDAYRRMLDTIYGLPGCLFVAAPDVVGDSARTGELWDEWYDELSAAWLPLALVAQDGLKSEDVPWASIDALFIGGTTAWKMGPDALALVREARVRDKWVHMGRVNGRNRLTYARAIGCDSVDGTKYAVWRDTYLPDELAWLASHRQLTTYEEDVA